MSLLDEYKQLQQKKSSAGTQQQSGTQRKSLLQEYVDNNGSEGLNKGYVESALKNGGGFGAKSMGMTHNDDGTVSYPITASRLGEKNYLKNYVLPYMVEEDEGYQDIMRYYNWRYGYKDKYRGMDASGIAKAMAELDNTGDEYSWLSDYNWTRYADEEDFEQFAGQGASINNPSKKEAEGWLQVGPWRAGAQDVGNIVTYSRDNWESIAQDEYDGGTAPIGRSLYHYMTEDEVGIYNYLLAKNGNESAQEYLDHLEETLNYRQGTETGENIRGIKNPALRTGLIGMAGFGAGVDQFVGGTKQFFTEEKQNTSATQFMSQNIQDNLDGLWKYAYQATTNIGNMAPSILVSAMTGVPAAGAAVMGVSASGNAYGQALDMGMTKGQARTYSTLVGAAEGGLQYLLGGIGSLGGVSSEKLLVKVAGIDNALLRIAAKGVINIGSEITEEELQNYLEPFFRSIITGEDYDAPTMEELLETAIVTALSTGILEGPSTVAGDVRESREYSRIYGNSSQELVTEALELNPESEYAQQMQRRLDSGKTISGHSLGRLAEQNEAAKLNQDRASIQEAAAARLAELGETGDVQAVARALAKQAEGVKLSRAEQELISKSRYGRRVSNELNPENIRSGEYASGWAESIGTNSINADEYNRIVEAAQIREDTEEVSVTAEPEVPQAPVESVLNNRTVQEPAAQESPVVAAQEAPAQAEPSISIEEASSKYGAQAADMAGSYEAGQDVAQYDAAYSIAYDMGQSGADLLDHAKSSGAVSYLSEAQIEAAYKAGQKASTAQATERARNVKEAANGNTGRKRGVVRGDGVTIKDLNEFAKSHFNTQQGKAFKILSSFAEATGIDIVLYSSTANEQGEFEGAQGSFKWKDNTVYIDVNSGLKSIKGIDSLGKYTMLRTFSHEFVHFIEKYDPEGYNEFRKVIFDTLSKRGENVADLIETKIAQSGLDENGKPMSYNMASREVVAEAMTDILPDSSFVQELAEKHRNVFETLLEKLKEFVSELKDYFNSLAQNPSREANALKEEVDGTLRYMEDIVKMFDKVAVQAVENYQATVATEEVVVAKNANTTAETKTETTETKEETEIVSETATETETPTVAKKETVEVKAEPKTTTSENGYTITDNSEYNSIEIKFNEKPSEAVRVALKANKFRWNGKKGVWYGRTSHEEIMEALDQVYAAEKAAAAEQAEEPKAKPNPIVENTVKAAERAADPNDPYSRLEGVMKSLPRFYTGGFLFRVHKAGKNNAYWAGEINKATQKEGYEIADARGLHYTSELFSSRSEALEDIIAVARNNRLLDGEASNNKEEVKEDGENLDNTGTVRQSDSDRQGDTPVLEAVQTEDVPGDAPGRDPVGSAAERGSEAARDDVRDDPAGNEGERGDGGSQSGDLRRADGLSEAEAAAKAEELHEVVTEQIEQQSTEQPKGRNFVIDESLNLPSGAKGRFRANVDAIRLIKKLDSEGRHATAAEQEILSKYVGWGGLSEAFGELTFNRETRKSEMTPKADWAKEFTELRQLVTDGIITEEEYQAASKSTQNAHYTSVDVIRAMYEGLAQLGFKGGRMLEPSSGVGNFVGGMPSSMSGQVKSWTMVELDRITGQIAKYLYPQSDVRIQGFEKANIPDNFMDVAIGNVPFGNYGVMDKAYPKRITAAIHNYFFAKSLDKVRPGGIVMFITSSFTMNGADSSVRQYIMDRADLLGAIRLPNNAFAGNAGTQVVTDILILKKRVPGTAYAGEAFLDAPYTNMGGYQGTYMNEYFTNHPEMALGKPAFTRGMYGANTLTYEPFADRGSLGEQIREAFKHIKGQMDYQTKPSPEKTNFAVERATKKSKAGSLVVHADGSISRNEDGNLVPVKTDSKTAKRIAGLLSIRDAYRKLASYLQQGQDAKYINKARKELNEAYDKFVKENGYINSPANRKAIAEDPDSFAIYALENYDAEKKTGTKADIFTKDTISPNRTINHVDDIASGIIVSINQTGGVDAALIAKLTGKTEEAVTRELIDSRMAFKTRDGRLEAPESYLSGNVRAKLREAEGLAPIDKDFENNVEELKKVIPTDIPFHEIYVSPGAPWIPVNVYADFIAEMLGGYNSESSYRGPDIVVGKSSQGDFKIVVNNARLKQNHLNTQKWGTRRRTFLDLIEAMMASRSVTVNDQIEDPLTGNKRTVVNKVETAAAQEKVEEITKEFQDWLWRDENRRAELATLYNEVFNALVTPKYDGSNLTVNGQNPQFSLRQHQADAVQRIISSGGNTLLAHKVGAGKTLEMAAAAMKLRELGIVKKPLFVVPKALVAQWGVEFMNYYPAAKLLVSDEKSFTKANRKTYANRIANGDYDAVIVSYEQFEKIPMSADFQREFYQEQINEILDAIAEERAETKGKGITVKEMEKKKAQLEKKIAELTTKAKDEDNIDFEQLGVDSVFVDEAHNFKNLQYVSRMNNISGLGNKDGSQRAFDLYTKVRYLQKLNGGRGIVFATATPVMNSMAEMYIMQKYLQSDMLDQLGLKSFDAWAKQFGEVVNTVEIKPSGQGFRVKQTFSNFRNLNELQLLFRSFSDVLTKVPGLKVPKMKGGKVNVVVCEPGQFQKDYMSELEKRADNVKNVDPSVDNMLKITSDGRKVSYTQRMIDPTLPYEPGCKIYRCCENVLTEYKNSKEKRGTQIIFCDMATPKGKSKTTAATESTDDAEFDTESAKLYDDMQDYLVKKGIPAQEIAFIHEADTDQKKKKLFADVNEGKVRVLIGSTGKMGVGMNAQRRIVAIHHLDAPWRPGDVEQRDGRAFRQGNINEEVSKYTYVTEGSFDARLWDILDRKQHFINQIMNGEDVGRSAEDTGDVTLSAAEVKALASGNPLIEEHVKLTTELQKLENLRLAHNSNITRAKARLAEDEKNIASRTTFIANLKEDIKARVDTYSEGKFSITIGKQKFTEKKDAGTALIAAIKAKATEDAFTTIGKFAGFELRVIKQGPEYKGILFGKQGYGFNVYESNTTYGINHLIAIAESMGDRLSESEARLKELKVDRDAQRDIIAEPFAKQAELDRKRARFNEIMEILNPKEEQSISEEELEQHQSRAYLDDADSVKQSFGIKSLNDYVAVQKAVIETLTKENFFDGKKNVVINDDSSMVIEITADGIKETLGPGKRFQYLPSSLKALKLDTIRDLPSIIKTARLVQDDVPNQHNPASAVKYAYLTNDILVDSDGVAVPYEVTISIRKSPQKNRFWIHEIRAIKKEQGLSSSSDANPNQEYNKTLVLEDSVSQEKTNFNSNISAAEHEQHQQRIEPLTDREVLAMAASELGSRLDRLSDGEKDALRIFNQRLNRLEELENKRAEEGRLYKEQQFGAKVDREAAKATLNRMHVLDSQIKRASEDVLNVENKAVLKSLLQKARKVVEQQEREHGQEILRRWRERRKDAAAIKKYRDRLRGDVDELTNWVLHPNNKDVMKHVPDALKNTVVPFLSSINFMSKRQLKGGNPTQADEAFVKHLNALKGALKQNIDLNGLYSGYNDLPPDFMDNLQTFIDTTQELVKKNSGEFVINQMTGEELKELSKVVRALKKYIMQMNRFHVNAMYQHVYEAGDDAILHMGSMGEARKTGTVSNFVLWQNIRPAYAFERFGEGGMAIYDGLRRGQSTLAFNTRKITDFAEKAYTAAEVKAWEKEVKTFRLGGDVVKIPVSGIMSLYELSKRPQALTHILGGGIRVATFSNDGQKISDVGHTLTPDELKKITGALTPRQKEVADKLQQFMAKQGGEWGNYVSVKRWGEELFGEEHYFPINSDGRHLQATADEHPSAASLYALLNMSFTKELQENANNRVILYSIFDVFANHMASMAQYNAFALPVLDALKWFNYQQKSEADENGKRVVVGSVREQMARAFGVPEETRPGSGRQGYAESFFMNIIKAFNGTEAQGVPTDTTGLNALRRYNMAQVAYNLRVVVQQPMAITRAALLVDYGSILKGMRLKPAEIQRNIEEMQKYSGIAAWKSLGFYDINISRGITDIIKHDTTWRDKVSEIGMWGAEKADLMTWASIWSAAKEEVIRKQKIRPESELFFEAVTKLFEDIIYKTQVVDSVLTKNEYLRSKGFFSRAIGSFMSEPTTTVSMLVDAFDKFSTDMNRGMTRQQAWKRNGEYIVRVAYVYGIGAALLAAVQAVADAWRDDDDYQSFFEKWLEAFGGNLVDELMPINKLPILSDFYDVAKELLSILGVDTYGTPPQSVFMQWWDSLAKGVEILYGKIQGTESNYTWYGGAYKLLQAASGISGLPMAAAVREINAAWNNTVGAMAPSLKVKDYEASERNQIKYAYQDGWLDEEEATSQLLEKGVAADQDDAYWIMREWESGEDSFSRYDAIYDAVRNGGDFSSAMDELTAHGYSERDVISAVRGQIGTWYRDMEISKSEATAMLTKYGDMDSEEISKTVTKWSAKVVTGIAYEDIKQAYLDGDITESRAVEMRAKYGSYSREDARSTVNEWKFEKETGIPYDELADAYEDGEISAVEYVDARIKYGQSKTYIGLEEDYNTYGSPAGLGKETFYSVWLELNPMEAVKDANGETIGPSLQEMRWDYINNLNLSTKQKDAFHCAFYSQKTLSKTPWH